jgi:putative nucleotidyltransferase with HDIG domain
LLKKEVEGKHKIEALNKELVTKVNDLYTFNKIMTEFTGIGSSDELFSSAVRLGVEITGASETSFFIITDENEEPGEVICARKTSSNNDNDTTMTMHHNGRYTDDALKKLIMEIVRDKVPLLITSCHETRGLAKDIASIMVVPLQIKERVFGILTAVSEESDAKFVKKEMLYFSFLAKKAASAVENIALYENIFETLFATLNALVRAVEARDEYTKMHSQRVAEVSVMLGEELGCSREELDILNFAGKLHDIGKIGIRDIILLKEGKLTDEEFEIIKTHPEIGAKIVSTLGLWEKETEVIRHHHEKYNGKGYPDGLKGDDIPFLARIMSVADAYDAMASDRAYRKRLDVEKIKSIISNESGEQFDPEVVKAFFIILEKGRIKIL